MTYSPKYLKRLLPLCALVLTACGGGGGGGNGGNENPSSFDAAAWASHPGAENAAEQSSVPNEPLVGKTMTVSRSGSDTTLKYSFDAGGKGSYRRETSSGTDVYPATYQYEVVNPNTLAKLVISADQGQYGIARHEYTLTFTSAKNATGTLNINTAEDIPLHGLQVEFK